MESDWDHVDGHFHRPMCTTPFREAIHVPRSTNVHHSSTPRQTNTTEPYSTREHWTTECRSVGCDDETPELRERFPRDAAAYNRFPNTSRTSTSYPSRDERRIESHRKYSETFAETRGTPEHFHELSWNSRNGRTKSACQIQIAKVYPTMEFCHTMPSEVRGCLQYFGLRVDLPSAQQCRTRPDQIPVNSRPSVTQDPQGCPLHSVEPSVPEVVESERVPEVSH